MRTGGQDGVTQNCLSNSACYPVRETAWRLWVGEGPDPTPDENTGGGGKKGGGHPRKKRESRITLCGNQPDTVTGTTSCRLDAVTKTTRRWRRAPEI